jgi:hypothetical protein
MNQQEYFRKKNEAIMKYLPKGAVPMKAILCSCVQVDSPNRQTYLTGEELIERLREFEGMIVRVIIERIHG